MFRQRLMTAAILLFAPTQSFAGDIESTVESSSGSAELTKEGLIPTDQAIGLFRSRIQSETDFGNRLILGRLYLRKAKNMGDLPSYSAAKAILREAVELKSDSHEARYYLAQALSACHDFAGSIALLNTIVLAEPANTAYMAGLGDAQLHSGQYKQAAESYKNLSKLSDAPAVLSRLAHLDVLYGRIDEALRLFEEAAESAAELDLPRSQQAWFWWRLGDVQLSQGSLHDAEESFEAALRIRPNDPAAMLGTAKVLAASGHLIEATKFVRRLVDLYQEPPAMAYLADLHGLAGNQDQQERWLAEADDAMAEEAKVAAAAHYREYAMFLANHKRRCDDALMMAEKDAQLRRDIYSDDVLAWTSFRAGRIEAAVRHIERALRLGTRDASLHDHAACIYAASRQSEKSKHHQALMHEINPLYVSQCQSIARPTSTTR